MRITVMIPTFNNGRLIRCAIRSVLRQTHRDFELLVVADGAPASTARIVEKFAEEDPRVKLLAYEKGERHGERWRHDALQKATGEAVCYLSDDDFWFPDHLAVMSHLLTKADFAHTRHTSIVDALHVRGYAGDIRDRDIRQLMRKTKTNIFGLSFAGHRMDAYGKLPEGWSPAPADIWTDLHMWRKLLAAPGIKFGASSITTGLNLPAMRRREMSAGKRLTEQRMWYEIFSDPYLVAGLRKTMPKTQDLVTLAAVATKANQLRARKPTLKEALHQVARALR